MKSKIFSSALFAFGICVVQAAAEPRANGETLVIQNFANLGNMHALVAVEKGFCNKYNFNCSLNTINSAALGVQALVGGSIDVAMIAPDLLGAANVAGADLVVLGTSMPGTALSVTVRNDAVLPNEEKGYPALMQDFKGKRIGVTARGSTLEKQFNGMLRDAGMAPEDVTYVAVGSPATAYTSLAVGKQIDAAFMFQPIAQLCSANQTCRVVMDLSEKGGEGPDWFKAMTGAQVVFAARRDTVQKSPELVAAFEAAMTDAGAWIHDAGNLEALVAIYEPLVSFGDAPGTENLLASWIEQMVDVFSKDLSVKVSALQQVLDYASANGVIDGKIEAAEVLWDKAPQTP